MTDTERIAEIRGRLDAASGYPWTLNMHRGRFVVSCKSGETICKIEDWDDDADHADGTFISESPSDMGYLLDKAERLEEDAENLRNELIQRIKERAEDIAHAR